MRRESRNSFFGGADIKASKIKVPKKDIPIGRSGKKKADSSGEHK